MVLQLCKLCNLRRQVTRFGDEYCKSSVINGGDPQGSRIGAIAFIIHINALHAVIKDSENNSTESSLESDNDDELCLWMIQRYRKF